MENQQYYLNKTQNGWQTKKTFLMYVDKVIQEMRSKKGGVTGSIVLIVDGFPGHISIELQKYCNENDVIFIVLLPNATHLLQPLDVVVFRPVKVEYKKQSALYKRNENKMEINEVDFVRILSRTLKAAMTPELIKKSFTTTNFFPLSSSFRYRDRIVVPSQPISTTQLTTSQISVPSNSNAATEQESNFTQNSSEVSQDFVTRLMAFNREAMTNIKEGDVASQMCLKAIEQQLGFLQNLHGNPQQSPLVIASSSSNPLPSSSTKVISIDDILKIPVVPPKTRKRKFKAQSSGILSTVNVITAVEEQEAEKEAKKSELECRKKARIEKKTAAIALKQEMDAMKQQKNEEKPKRAKAVKSLGKAKK